MVVGASCGFGCGPRRPRGGCEVMGLLLLPGRGAGASASERAAVEEAQVALETLDVAGAADIDLELLSGKWRLVYTTAADVL